MNALIRSIALLSSTIALSQIAPTALAAEGFSGTLSSDQEVPPVVATSFGGSQWSLDASNNMLSFRVVSSGIDLDGNQTPSESGDDLTGAHIHAAPTGANGGVIVNLAAIGTVDAQAGTISGQAELSAQEIELLREEGLYVNLHTNNNPGGEIRGQILPRVTAFEATLEGVQEVPPVTTTATGNGILFLNRARDRMEIEVRLTGLDLDGAQTPGNTNDDVTSGHIHRAPAGSNGPVVFGFIGPNSDANGDLDIDPSAGTVESAWDSAEGNSTTLTAELDSLRTSGLYFNFHSTGNPGGEVRGQIDLSALLDDDDLDGIRNSLDQDVANPGNICDVLGDDAVLTSHAVISGTTSQCAAANSISIASSVTVPASSQLELLAPNVSFSSNFGIPQGAVLKVVTD